MDGYLALALHDPRYLDLAANFALSVKRLEHRPVSVVVSPGIELPIHYHDLFDQIIRMDDQPSLRGAMVKALLYDLSPYERTMYIDSDCLLFSPRIEFFWRQYKGHPFAVEGHVQSSGPVFECSLGVKEAEDLCALVQVEHLAVFNSGVMYFETGDASKQVFETVVDLFEGPLRNAISYPYKHAGEYADEPYFACALSMLGIEPFRPPLSNRLQVTTPNLIDAIMDLNVGELQLVKQSHGPKPTVWSGVLCHFCGLDPMDMYFDLADLLRDEADFPRMDRSKFEAKVITPTNRQRNS